MESTTILLKITLKNADKGNYATIKQKDIFFLLLIVVLKIVVFEFSYALNWGYFDQL